MSLKFKFIKLIEPHAELPGAAQVILNRPELRNAFNPEMIAEIKQAFKHLAKRQDLRAVVLAGEGKSFCAGADLNWMREMVDYSLAQNKKDAEQLFDLFETLAKCPFPLIGVVQGAAMGGALGLIACCDLVIAEEKTVFAFSEVKLGIAPAVISHFVLQKANRGMMTPLMLTGRNFSASEAQSLGLVHVLAKEDQATSALHLALQSFKEAAPQAVRETKALIAKVQKLSANQAKLLTTKVIAQRRVSAEGQEGLKSFLEKKSPSWK